MSLSNDDLDDYVEKFRKIFYKQEDYKTNEIDTWSLIDNLAKELESSKESEDCLQKNLARCLEGDHEDITTRFVALGEKFEKVEKENADLKNQLDDLQVQSIADAELQKDEYFRTLAELVDKHKSETVRLMEQMERDRISFQTKEKELYMELQATQAASDLRCDEIESNLKRQIVDANNKLRNSQNIIRSLQMDIHNLRNQLATQQAYSHNKPSKSEIRFEPLPVTSTTRTISYDLEELESEDMEFLEVPPPIRTTETLVRTTTPLSACSTSVSTNFDEYSGAPTVFKGANRRPMKLVPSEPNKVKKKRKLYDPNNLDHANFPLV